MNRQATATSARSYQVLSSNLAEGEQVLQLCETDCAKLLRLAVLRRDAPLLRRILEDCAECPHRLALQSGNPVQED